MAIGPGRSVKRKKINRSRTGNALVILFLLVCGSFTALPMWYAIITSFKPLNELWLYPPNLLFVKNPTLKSYTDLILMMSDSLVPFSRYIFNSLFITVIGTAGNVIFASMCAYPLAKRSFPGSRILFKLVIFSLMFTPAVTSIPVYQIMSRIGWINSYLAVIIPAFGMPIGLYLIRQFMLSVPDSILESAKIDGADEWKLFWTIIMPQVKPAWLTVIIFSMQGLWNMAGNNFILSEELKTLPYALGQIITAGFSRAGVGAAATVIILSVPIAVFIATQSQIVETMASSGIKE